MDIEVVLGSGCPPPTHASGHTVATPRRRPFFRMKWARTPCPGHRAPGPGSHQGASHDRTACTDLDRKSTRLNSSHLVISYAVFCLKKKKIRANTLRRLRVAHLSQTARHPRR